MPAIKVTCCNRAIHMPLDCLAHLGSQQIKTKTQNYNGKNESMEHGNHSYPEQREIDQEKHPKRHDTRIIEHHISRQMKMKN